MATVSFTIPDEHLPRFIDAMADHYGYRSIIDGQPNAESKVDYIRRKIRRSWISIVKKYETQIIDPEEIDIS